MKKKPTVIKSFDQLSEVLVSPTLIERVAEACHDIDMAHAKLSAHVHVAEPKRVSLLAKQKGRY